MGPPSKSSHDAAQSNPDRAEAAVCGKGSTDAGKGFKGLVPPTPMPEVPHVGTGSELGRNWVGRNWVRTGSELGRNGVGTGSLFPALQCFVRLEFASIV